MHPAYSVILFTTASGAGYGLLFVLGLLRAFDLVTRDWWFGATAIFIALGLITVGLLASTFHLGRPERAWRAFSQWRSSWLSREGVASVATYVPALAFWALWLIPGASEQVTRAAGILTAVMALITVYCTAKIYSTLTTIRQWNNHLVPPVYLLMALASGAVLFLVLARLFSYDRLFYGFVAMGSVIAALLIKLAYWRSIDREPPRHTMAEAIGLGRDTGVRQWEVPHTTENFIMKEMGYRVARKHAAKLRNLVAAAFFLALVALIAGQFAVGAVATLLSVAALLAVAVALLVERWLFFAEAQHVAMLYYGAERA
jgi:sulfite dehydrogenase (quinone) subunit SoeC